MPWGWTPVGSGDLLCHFSYQKNACWWPPLEGLSNSAFPPHSHCHCSRGGPWDSVTDTNAVLPPLNCYTKEKQAPILLKPLYLGVFLLYQLAWAQIVFSHFVCKETVKSNNFLNIVQTILHGDITAELINRELYKHAKDLRRTGEGCLIKNEFWPGSQKNWILIIISVTIYWMFAINI